MEQTPSRNKLRNLPVPQGVIRCFLCGKPLVTPKGDLTDEALSAATGGIMILSCPAHIDLAETLLNETVATVKAGLQQAKEQQTKTE